MICKKCGEDTLEKQGDIYVCKNCGAMAADADNEEAIRKINEKQQAQGKDGKKEKKPKSKFGEVLDFCAPIVIAVVVALLLKTFVFANAVVPTGSMLNTIHEGDRIIASRIVYNFDDPERYDIIIFDFPDDESQQYVKRIIGLPGETVNIVNGVVYVTDTEGNTKQLRDDFVTNCVPTGNYGPYEVPEDCYFVLGDNRNNSVDARFWRNTYVRRDAIIGKVMFRYYPSIGKIE